jgi:hypothetical protein
MFISIFPPPPTGWQPMTANEPAPTAPVKALGGADPCMAARVSVGVPRANKTNRARRFYDWR